MSLVLFNGMHIKPESISWIGQVVTSADDPHGKFSYAMGGTRFEVRGTPSTPAVELHEQLLALASRDGSK